MSNLQGPWSFKDDRKQYFNSETGLPSFEIRTGKITSENTENIAAVHACAVSAEEYPKICALIASAPELLSALEKLLSHCAHIQQIPMHTIIAARSAVAKAKGES